MTAARDRDLATAQAYLAALGGEDPDAVASLVTDDFVNEHHAEIAQGCVGRGEYRRRLPGFFATFPNRHYTIEETTVGAPAPDDGVTTEVIVRYRFGADAEGVRLDIPGVMWISVVDGLVRRRLDCWDSLTYFRQTGQSPPVAES